MKKLLVFFLLTVFAGIAVVAGLIINLSSDLPKLITVEDYEPNLISEVYDRNGKKFGEFFIETRTLVPYEQIPPMLINAFLSAEDSQFFEHGGINYQAIFRAMLKNIKAGRWVQGGSTITQQVAKTLLLSPEKTLLRKAREALLAYRMESHLSKKEILYLYFNQIYFGQGAYGIYKAARTYFRKELEELDVHEMAMLAGLPQAPSRYSPLRNPKRAKRRQRYVLGRMVEEGFITEEQRQDFVNRPLNVYFRENFRQYAPYYLETIRQMVSQELGEKKVLKEGIRIYTGLDIDLQTSAQEAVRKGLRSLDKRQGFRGADKNLTDPEQITEFLLATRNKLIRDGSQLRVINSDGTIEQPGPMELDKELVPEYLKTNDIVDAVVTGVNDKWGFVTARFAETKGIIDMDSMKWARQPDPSKHFMHSEIENPSEALKVGDVVQVRLKRKKFSSRRINRELAKLKEKRGDKFVRPEELPEFDQYTQIELEQEPVAEGALLSFDLRTGEVISMVGGYNFSRSEFNRTIQSQRQTGSAFKAIVYAAAMDKGYNPATPITNAPLVFEEQRITEEETDEGVESISEIHRWKPKNHSKKFGGDILFRNALIKSLNVPTIRIMDQLGVEWVADYAKRLGIFSPLNMDMTLGLGSSGVTLYEMTKVFSHLARKGRKLTPLLIRRVEDKNGNVLLENVSLDKRFEAEITESEREYEERRVAYLNWKRQNPNARWPNQGDESPEEALGEEESADTLALQKLNKKMLEQPPLFFKDPNQLMKPTTAYLLTNLLHATVHERGGTGGAARVLGRPLAGKTGSTSDYFDAWFMGYSPYVTTGVWVGFDEEKSLGKSEVGGRAALPVWIDYMKAAHEHRPASSFSTPEGIVFVNIDNETGLLASANSKKVVRQAFVEGTEPQSSATVDESDISSQF